MSELQPVQPLTPSPFKCLVATVGNIPTSFAQSLSYFEALQKLAKYIQDVLIPALNGDTEAIEELQAKYIELKNYVDTYFDNLDVQEEINNKLDDMAEHGQLAEIIAQYIQLAGILAYDTVADLKNATNIVAGSFVETYGFYAKGDGGGAKYKIRKVLNDDVVDEMFLIEITADPSDELVAELVFEDEMNVLKFGIKNDGSVDETENLQKLIDKEIPLFLKDGTYLVEGELTGDVTIIGESQKTIIYGGETKHKVIDVSDPETTYKAYIANVAFNNAWLKLYDAATYASKSDTRNIYAENVWFDESVEPEGSTYWGEFIKTPKPANYNRYGASGYACYPLEVVNNSGYNAIMINNICTDENGDAQAVSDNSAIGIIDKVSSSAPTILVDQKHSRDLVRLLNASATYKQDSSVFEINSQGHLALGCRVAPDANLTGYATLKLQDENPNIIFYNNAQNQTDHNQGSVMYAGDKPDRGFRFYIQSIERFRITSRGFYGNRFDFATIQSFPASDLTEGSQIWDTTNHRPLWFNGTSWITGDGTSVYTPA